MKKSILLLKAFFLTVVMMVGSMSVMADNLAVWDPIDNGTTWLTQLNTTSATNVVTSQFVRGVGLGESGSAAGWSFGGRCEANTKASAIENQEYFFLTIRADEGYKMSLTGIPTWYTRKSGAGVTQIYVQYALNGGEFADAGNITITSTSAPGSNTPLTFSTAAQTALSDLPSTTTVMLRFVVVTSVTANVYVVTGNAANNTNRFVVAGTIVDETSPSYTITAESNNETYGTVSLQGNVITATPASCLYVYASPAYTVTPTGAATVTQEGNEFTVENLTDNVTVTINFMENPTPPTVYTVTFMDKNEQVGELQTDCGEVTVPATVPTSDCVDWIFVGWAEDFVNETNIAPTLYLPNATIVPSSNMTLHAVYEYATDFTASLTQEEILGNGENGGYASRTIVSASGNWTGSMGITTNATPAFLQINTTGTGGAVGSHILSPTFEGIVSSVKITYASNTAANRRFKIIDENETVLGTSANTVASTGGSVVISNLDAVVQSNRFQIESEGGAVYIVSIEVTFKEDEIYNSNPICIPSYTITAESNNETYGTVNMQGNVITATPASCLYAYASPAYTVTPTGAATVVQEGDEFAVEDLTNNVTVTINFMENPTPPAVYTVTFMDRGEQAGELQTDCNEIIIPETVPTSDCTNWIFAGWAETEDITTAPVLYLPNATFTSSSNTTLYAVFKFAKEFAVSLTQAEILGSGQDGGYADRTIASASGNWTGWFSITSNSAPGFLQINTGGTGLAEGSYILSPVFEGIISSIEVYFMNENTTTRTIRIMDLSNNLLASYIIPAQTTGSYTFTGLDINDISQFKVFSATNAGALRITGIDVIYKENEIYNSNPNCTPTINVNLETLELDFGSVTIGETSIGKTIEVSGMYLFDDILYAKDGGDASAFTVEETSWDPANGGTLTITFNPTEKREYNATLIISSQDAEDVIITLTGIGTGTTSCKEVSANAIFGYAMNNNIYLNNLPGDSYIYVYGVAGQLIASQKADASEVILSAVQKGSLIVKIVSGTNAQTLKIFNK